MRLQAAMAIAGYQPVCEDRVEILRLDDAVLLVVADGVGGRAGGMRAADLAVEYIRSGAHAMPPDAYADYSNWDSLLSAIDDALGEDREAGETTAVIAVVSPPTMRNMVLGTSVGDSGAWLVTADGYQDVTENQRLQSSQGSYPGFLGSGSAMPFWFCEELGESTLLLATDGLLKYARAEDICRVCHEPDIQAAATHLIELVRLPSGQLWDDVAVALCRRA